MTTARRLFRLNQTLHRRQTDMVVALDQVHDRHNVSAVLRTSDAVGIPLVLWAPDNRRDMEVNPEVAQGSERWVELKAVRSVVSALETYKKKKYQIVATHLSAKAVDFRQIDWNQPTVLVMGNERRGCSEEVLEVATHNIVIPMFGLIQSLNISVATAVILYEFQRHREGAGRYARRLPKRDVERFFKRWRLEDEGMTLDQVLAPPPPDAVVPAGDEHNDGRNSFSQKLKERRLLIQSQERTAR
jgi:tRNA (guanosine-2'-O-)-methyltransferase